MMSLMCGIVKSDTNELSYETETDSQTWGSFLKGDIGAQS